MASSLPHATSPATLPSAPSGLVIGGVAGVGKTTVGRRVADRLGWAFVDGDAFHAATSVAKMRNGTGLNDADRISWLSALGAEIDRRRADGAPFVLAASLLRAAYRRQVRAGRPGLAIVMLTLDRDRLAARLDARRDHFAGRELLDSQLATLELPGSADRGAPSTSGDPDAVVAADGPPDRVADRVLDALGLGGDAGLSP